jgi:hypothetical protein
MTPLPVPRAARELGVSPATLRRWIREDGAPCVALGSVGRNCGSTVDVNAVRLWRAERMGIGAPAQPLQRRIVEAVGDVLKRDDGSGKPTHLRLGVSAAHAAELLYQAVVRVSRVIGSEIDHE